MSSIPKETPTPTPTPAKATETANVLSNWGAKILATFTGLHGIEFGFRPRMAPAPDAPPTQKQYGASVQKLERDGKTVYFCTASGGTVDHLVQGVAEVAARLYNVHVSGAEGGRIPEVTRKRAESAVLGAINPGIRDLMGAFLKDYERRASGVKGFLLILPDGQKVTVNLATKGNAVELFTSALREGVKVVSKDAAAAYEKAEAFKRDLRENPAYAEQVAKVLAELQMESNQ
jgi:acylphosphatase